MPCPARRGVKRRSLSQQRAVLAAATQTRAHRKQRSRTTTWTRYATPQPLGQMCQARTRTGLYCPQDRGCGRSAFGTCPQSWVSRTRDDKTRLDMTVSRCLRNLHGWVLFVVVGALNASPILTQHRRHLSAAASGSADRAHSGTRPTHARAGPAARLPASLAGPAARARS